MPNDSVFQCMEKIPKLRAKRNFTNKPISSFTSKDWYEYFDRRYLETYGKPQFELSVKKYGQFVLMQKFVCVKTFGERDWSAQELIDFINIEMANSVNSGYNMNIFSFKRPYIQRKMVLYDEEMKKDRASDKYHKDIYHKHFPIFSQNDNLMSVLSLLEESIAKMICSFGMVITHRYLQQARGMSFTDSSVLLRNTIKSKIIKDNMSDENIIYRIMSVVLKNTILWGPYVVSKNSKKRKEQIESIYDWQNDLEPIWRYFELNKTEMWDEREFANLLPAISLVKKMMDIK